MPDTLTDRIERHEALAKAAISPMGWFMPDDLAPNASRLTDAEKHHIAANDPATIKAFCAVAKDIQRQADDPAVGCPLCGNATQYAPHDEDCPMFALYNALGGAR